MPWDTRKPEGPDDTSVILGRSFSACVWPQGREHRFELVEKLPNRNVR